MVSEHDMKEFYDIIQLESEFATGLELIGGASCLYLLRRSLSSLLDSNIAAHEKYAIEARDRIWEHLHSGNWKDVLPVYRQAYGYSCILQALALMKMKKFRETMTTLDMAIIMAGPNCSDMVHKLVEECLRRMPCEKELLQPYILHSPKDTIQLKFPIPRVSSRSLTLRDFRQKYLITNTPVIIYGVMEDWPALGKEDHTRMWKNINYLRRIAGHRTVPVEVGKNYMDHEWGQKLMTLNDFINSFIIPAAAYEDKTDLHIAYLAQHNLFEQIPTLAKDFSVPDYCVLGRDESEEAEYSEITANAWFGPQGTVSPLHFDPRDNLFGQVFGRKYIRLYSPEEGAKLYPSDGVMSNTSNVDVENVDAKAYPMFTHARYSECVLEEGEMLFIPKHHWHYVRSLAISFSINFWW